MSGEVRVTYWRTLVEKQAETGQSGTAFCKEQNINSQRLYFWRRRFHGSAMGLHYGMEKCASE